MQFRIDVTGALRGLDDARARYRRGTALYGQTAAVKMEAYAKVHAPWHDRTTIRGIYGWGSATANLHSDSGGYVNEAGEYVSGYINKEGETVDDAGEYIDTSIPYTRQYLSRFPGGSEAPSDADGGSGEPHTFVIGVSGNMNYSPHLEYAFGQKYAILKKAVNAGAAETINGWAAMLRALH